MKSTFVKLAMVPSRAAGWIKARVSDEGASLVEYALLVALIAGVAVSALVFLGGAAHNTLQNVGNTINGA